MRDISRPLNCPDHRILVEQVGLHEFKLVEVLAESLSKRSDSFFIFRAAHGSTDSILA